jgi:biotin carboxyl carrier protein
MTIRIKSDALLAVGSTSAPVDLVCMGTGQRLPLSSDEATVAMLLIDGVESDEALLRLSVHHGVPWDPATVRAFLARLSATNFLLEPPPASTRASPAAPEGASDTIVVTDLSAYAVDEEAAEDDEKTVYDPTSPFAHKAASPDEAPEFEVPDLRAPPEARSASAAPKIQFDGGEGAPLRPLAAAAMMVCEGRHTEAQALLLALLAEEPANMQAQAMLDLMRSPAGQPGPRGRGAGLIVVASTLGVVLAALLVAGFLVKVPRSVRATCRLVPQAVGSVDAPIEGAVASVSARSGQVVRKDQVLAVLAAADVERRLAELRGSLPRQQLLLRIMRTGGTDADVKAFRQKQAELQAALEKGKATPALKQQVEENRALLKFCDWQALPREISDQQHKVEAIGVEIAALAGRQTRAELRSPEEGRVETILTEGKRVAKGDVVARLVHARRLTLEARAAGGTAAAGSSLEVVLGPDGTQVRSQVDRVSADGQIAGSVELDPARGARPTTTCTIVVPTGQVSWIGAKISGGN